MPVGNNALIYLFVDISLNFFYYVSSSGTMVTSEWQLQQKSKPFQHGKTWLQLPTLNFKQAGNHVGVADTIYTTTLPLTTLTILSELPKDHKLSAIMHTHFKWSDRSSKIASKYRLFATSGCKIHTGFQALVIACGNFFEISGWTWMLYTSDCIL